jgi:hypothetical protein
VVDQGADVPTLARRRTVPLEWTDRADHSLGFIDDALEILDWVHRSVPHQSTDSPETIRPAGYKDVG